MSTNLLLKQGLTAQQLAISESEFQKKAKSKTTAYLFWFFLGALGGHRFYVGDKGKGFLLLFTLGGLIIGTFIDLFFIGKRVEEINEQIELQILQKVQIAIGNTQQVAATTPNE